MTDPFTLAMVLIAALALMGQSIGISMLVGSFVYLMLKGYDVSIAAETMMQGLFNGYTLLAVPLFILAADIMNIGSLADKLLRFAQALVGRFRGGLGHVNVVSSLIFSGMSGSAVADAVGMGKIVITMMTRTANTPPAMPPRSPPPRPLSARSSRRRSRWCCMRWSRASRSAFCSPPVSCPAC